MIDDKVITGLIIYLIEQYKKAILEGVICDARLIRGEIEMWEERLLR